MSRTLYTVLTYLALPLIFARLWWRGRKAPQYRKRWRERLAWYAALPPCPRDTTVLFHAVSVGEVHAAQPVIEQLLLARPELQVVVTCTTPTGSERIRKLFAARVLHVYLPYDLPGSMHRLLSRFSPALLVLLETELWPNLLHACRQHRCPVLLANARLSERSFARYRKHAAITSGMLNMLDTVIAQAQPDGDRFVALGLPPQKLQVNGNLKFDVMLDANKLEAGRALKAAWGQRPVWIAASTREGEDSKVLSAFQKVLRVQPQLLLLLVPRHPERFGAAVALTADAGFAVRRYSEGGDIGNDIAVLVGDTMGDMAFYYALADIAFVGGSLVDTGCQNLIEPAALGLPVLSGPSLYNFQAVSELLQQRGGLCVVQNETELAEQVVILLADPARTAQIGVQAKAVVAGNQGATARLCRMILERLP